MRAYEDIAGRLAQGSIAPEHLAYRLAPFHRLVIEIAVVITSGHGFPTSPEIQPPIRDLIHG